MANGDEVQTIKLRVQIDACVLEAEGPCAAVQGYFDAWRKLLPPRPGEQPPSPPQAPPEDPRRLMFDADPQRGLVALKVRPKTRHPEADSVLLLLYGHEQLLPEGGEEVLGTRLKRSWNASGLRQTRIDRFLVTNMRAGLVKKSGERKASAYRLTAQGTQRAAVMLREVLRTAQP